MMENYTWHILIVPSNRMRLTTRDRKRAKVHGIEPEPFVQWLLRVEGFATFLPVRRDWRRISRYKKTKALHSFPLLPGYLFVGLNDDTPGIFHALKHDAVLRVICDAEPAPVAIPASALRDLSRRSDNGAFTAPGYQRAMLSNCEFNPGDEAEVVGGPLAGHTGKVQQIDGEVAKVLLPELFGAPREIETAVGNLAAA